MSDRSIRAIASQLIVDVDTVKRELFAGSVCLKLAVKNQHEDLLERVNQQSRWLFGCLAEIAKCANQLVAINKGAVGDQLDKAASLLPLPRDEFLPSAVNYLATEVSRLLEKLSTETRALHGLCDDFLELRQDPMPPALNADYWAWLADSEWLDPLPGVEKLDGLADILNSAMLINATEINNRIRAECARLEVPISTSDSVMARFAKHWLENKSMSVRGRGTSFAKSLPPSEWREFATEKRLTSEPTNYFGMKSQKWSSDGGPPENLS